MSRRTMAARVAELCRDAVAYSLAAGYAVGSDGRGRIFADHGVEAARREKEQRNAGGRCTLAVYRYTDGSRVRFTWGEKDGESLEVVP